MSWCHGTTPEKTRDAFQGVRMQPSGLRRGPLAYLYHSSLPYSLSSFISLALLPPSAIFSVSACVLVDHLSCSWRCLNVSPILSGFLIQPAHHSVHLLAGQLNCLLSKAEVCGVKHSSKSPLFISNSIAKKRCAKLFQSTPPFPIHGINQRSGVMSCK